MSGSGKARVAVVTTATAVIALAGSALAPSDVSGAWGLSAPRSAEVSPQFAAVDVAAEAGIATDSTKTWSAAPFDHDGDGDEDLLIGYHPIEKLWQNQGDGTYVRVAAEAWPEGTDRHSCAWADVDRNGLPDVYCATGRGLRNKVKAAAADNELWLQAEPGTFTDVGTEWGVGDPCGRGRSVAFIDANGDEWPDLFVGNHVSRSVEDPCDDGAHPNKSSKLFLNQGGTGFRHAPRWWSYGAGPGNRCIQVLDFNNDGWDDLFTCRGIGQTPRLYRNRKGAGFVDVTSRHPFGRRISDADVADFDRDGDPDLVVGTQAGFARHVNHRGRFSKPRLLWRAPRGFGMAVAWGDADDDGDLDVYGMVGNGADGNPPDRILLKTGSTWAPVRVPGAGGAADDVVAVDRFGTGPTEFLALNGYNLVGKGPVQLIRLIPR